MTFTEEDVSDDGRIKDETRGKLKGVAKREFPKLYEFFEDVCGDVGMDPGLVLADMVVKALNSEEYADRIESEEIDLKQVQMNDIREDDIEYIMAIREKFDSDSSSSFNVEDLIKQKLEQKASGPMGPLGQAPTGMMGNGGNQQANGEVQRLRQEIDELKSEMGREGANSGGQETDTTETKTVEHKTKEEREADVSSIFGGGDKEEEEQMDAQESQEEEIATADEEQEEEGSRISVDVSGSSDSNAEEEFGDEFGDIEEESDNEVEDDESEEKHNKGAWGQSGSGTEEPISTEDGEKDA